MGKDQQEAIVFDWVSEVLFAFGIAQETVNDDVELPDHIRALLATLEEAQK